MLISTHQKHPPQQELDGPWDVFLVQHTKPEPAEPYFPGTPLGKNPFLTLLNDPHDCGQRAASSPAIADPAKTRRAKEEAPWSSLAGSGGNGLLPPLLLTKGCASFGAAANLEAICQKTFYIPLLKYVSCAKRGPPFEGLRLKAVPGQPRGVTRSYSGDCSSANEGQTQAFGLLPTNLGNTSGTEVWKCPAPPPPASCQELGDLPGPSSVLASGSKLTSSLPRSELTSCSPCSELASCSPCPKLHDRFPLRAHLQFTPF